eukprot:TRINITY_DN92229_c0_g1_i1.p1 TRINITY_DN92229_c0_g1~~TRINITY_DN92229_c0_g1_i1.p1  ORF type:complete len:110 (-),score=12.88 TRINITY_DN92229_c0_g1_i1:261-590(-)
MTRREFERARQHISECRTGYMCVKKFPTKAHDECHLHLRSEMNSPCGACCHAAWSILAPQLCREVGDACMAVDLRIRPPVKDPTELARRHWPVRIFCSSSRAVAHLQSA